jgi:hypothetical protein
MLQAMLGTFHKLDRYSTRQGAARSELPIQFDLADWLFFSSATDALGEDGLCLWLFLSAITFAEYQAESMDFWITCQFYLFNNLHDCYVSYPSTI